MMNFRLSTRFRPHDQLGVPDLQEQDCCPPQRRSWPTAAGAGGASLSPRYFQTEALPAAALTKKKPGARPGKWNVECESQRCWPPCWPGLCCPPPPCCPPCPGC